MRAEDPVPRPLKRAEYQLVFLSRQAEKGWVDMLATVRSSVVDAWDRLTTDPLSEDGHRVYRLKGGLRAGSHDGNDYDRYQYKLPNGARIWYFVEHWRKAKHAGRVLIEDVHTAHPNETK